MKQKHLIFITLIILLASVISACSGGATTATSWPGLAADEKYAYLAYNQHIYAIDLANGLERWRFPGEADSKIAFYATPSLTSDGDLIAGSYHNVLYSLNTETGAELWSYSDASNRYIGSSLVVDDLIFAPNAGNKLFAFNSQGQMLWTFESQGALWAKPISDPDCTCIYLSSMDHRIYSIDAQSGRQNWMTDDLGGSIVGTPAFDPSGVLFSGTFASEMLAIDAQNGSIIWRTPTTGWVWGGPVLADNLLYFGDLSGTLYALNSQTGQISWTIQADGPISDSLLVTEDTIFFNTEAGSLYAIGKDGNFVWPQPKLIGNKLYTTPVLAGDTLLIAPVGAEVLLYGLDLNGNQKWTFVPREN
ncbi:MAG TPA: PQQ-binding-like beta-propeller repeat protein [Anaerolineales bacterium]|nr:PQQ-binding-like beta-propeller repeat protein [Anaerolineales bacterium]